MLGKSALSIGLRSADVFIATIPLDAMQEFKRQYSIH